MKLKHLWLRNSLDYFSVFLKQYVWGTLNYVIPSGGGITEVKLRIYRQTFT